MGAQDRALYAERQISKEREKKTILRTQTLQDVNVGQHRCENFLQVGSQGSGQ